MIVVTIRVCVRVGVFDRQSKKRFQSGNNIYGESNGNIWVWLVSISGDEFVVTANAPYNNLNGANYGHVCVHTFDYNSRNFVQCGNRIYGDAKWDDELISLVQTLYCTTIEIGAPNNDGHIYHSRYLFIFISNENTVRFSVVRIRRYIMFWCSYICGWAVC